jgi:hypothetical protein
VKGVRPRYSRSRGRVDGREPQRHHQCREDDPRQDAVGDAGADGPGGLADVQQFEAHGEDHAEDAAVRDVDGEADGEGGRRGERVEARERD